MIISDLNYLETAEGNVQGGLRFTPSYVSQTVNLNSYLNSSVYASGNGAFAQAGSQATGWGSITHTQTDTVTAPGSSESHSSSAAGSTGFFWCY